MPATSEHTRQAAIAKAKLAIRRILADLEEETGMSVNFVNVDTRNFSNLATEIFLTYEQRQ
jgi:hypothetical protein